MPIFDASVSLANGGITILDGMTGEGIGIGQPFQAAAASYRDGGRGWSLADIEAITGTTIPQACDTASIVRLRDLSRVIPDAPPSQ